MLQGKEIEHGSYTRPSARPWERGKPGRAEVVDKAIYYSDD